MHAAMMYYQHVRKSEEVGVSPMEYDYWLLWEYLQSVH